MPDWRSILRDVAGNIPWPVVLGVGGYVGGILTKPLQEHLSRWLQARSKQKELRQTLYTDLAWNLNVLYSDSIVDVIYYRPEEFRLANYYDARESKITTLNEATFLIETFEFFINLRQMKQRNPDLEHVLLVLDEFTFDCPEAGKKMGLKKHVLKKYSTPKIARYIDKSFPRFDLRSRSRRASPESQE
jgi:hypothetical protein